MLSKTVKNFYEFVAHNPQLQNLLTGVDFGQDDYVVNALRLAEENGYHFEAEDLTQFAEQLFSSSELSDFLDEELDNLAKQEGFCPFA